ncbi:hypothetical protein CALCODRAFT_104100 [Calocera cornea HHB12733]|uniref:Uncharacterized protein n=1 Tax=Calocera cornea HHB12733 TaxID=1353952 RepID=A0A165D4G7_9BASI|nr:hypothetical protein CALCODRAFT_104100 [Calocera cornea HHB12733]
MMMVLLIAGFRPRTSMCDWWMWRVYARRLSSTSMPSSADTNDASPQVHMNAQMLLAAASFGIARLLCVLVLRFQEEPRPFLRSSCLTRF